MVQEVGLHGSRCNQLRIDAVTYAGDILLTNTNNDEILDSEKNLEKNSAAKDLGYHIYFIGIDHA